MSTQNFHQGIFSFSNGFDRSAMTKHMVRGQVFEPLLPVPAQEEVSGELPMYETGGGMLSEIFAPAATTIFDNQIQSNYRWSQKQQPLPAAANESEMGGLGEQIQEKHLNQDQFMNINSQLVNSMQLSNMNMNTRVKAFSSPAPPPSALQMLFSSNPTNSHVRGFQLNSPAVGMAGAGLGGGSEDSPVQFTWLHGSTTGEDAISDNNKIGGAVESHGLSLSLSSSLETAKFEELRLGNGGIFFANNQGFGGASLNPYGSKNLRSDRQTLDFEGMVDRHGQVHVGFGTSLEMVNVLRNSKYVKAAQELLEELCCVGRGQYLTFKNQRPKKHQINPNSNTDKESGSGVGSSSPLSAADKSEYQRRKVKLLSMLDEVDGRYRHYCEKMQTMVNSFDSVMGFGAATTYTAMAQKAMSKHFRCIKNGIAAQLKLTCELLGEKDVTAGGMSCLTKGETPRLRLIEQSSRQQKSLHHMGMMELEAWRPQRGLPERSVNILRAWLFEHFLHPYPSDADKHLLSRQTGLSKNQVSNWFINARVRLWKPMVEDMYQQEAKEEEEAAKSCEPNSEDHPNTTSAQTPMHSTATTTTPPPSPQLPSKRFKINAARKDLAQNTINYRQHFLRNEIMFQDTATTVIATTATLSTACHDVTPSVYHGFSATHDPNLHNWEGAVEDMYHHESVELGDFSTASADLASPLARLGSTPAGDVSLTLGLRHTGNVPEKSQISVRNFGPH